MDKKKAFVFLVLTLLWSMICAGQQAASSSKPQQPGINVQQILAWLPVDTETIMVANGPFVYPHSSAKEDDNQQREISASELEEGFEFQTLGLSGFKKSILGKQLEGQRVALAVEGSRHFRPPRGLGEAPFEGCVIAVFADTSDLGSSLLMRNLAKTALRTEWIEGQKVAIFQERLELDLWTTFVTFPQRNVVVVATNRDYLRTVLARMRSEKGERALPATLPEWKYINQQAPFWGVRHFFRGQEQKDPTSPFGGKKSANLPDEQAIGIVFNYDRSKAGMTTVTYLSGDKNIRPKIERELFPSDSEPEANKGLRMQYRDLEPGVVEGSYELRRAESINWFFFMLMARLGHVVYL